PVNPTFTTNPPFVPGVTMKGIATANLVTLVPLDPTAGSLPFNSFPPVGFFGDITGLTTVNLQPGSTSNGTFRVGGPPGTLPGGGFALPTGGGLKTALQTVNFNGGNVNFSAVISAAALTGTPGITVNVNAPLGGEVANNGQRVFRLVSFIDDSGLP